VSDVGELEIVREGEEVFPPTHKYGKGEHMIKKRLIL
jgi:hypothetical protein